VVDVKERTLEPGDIILLCSDGLNTMLSDDEIKQVLERGGDLTPLAYQMVAEANRRGGVDNITVVLVSMAP
jgi:protein phosphatase